MRRSTPRSSRALALTSGLAGVLLAATACTADAAPTPEPDAATPAAGDDLPHLDAAIDRLPDRIAELLDETGVPGLAISVVHGDEVVYADGFGVADMETDAPVDADTVFQLASVSKPVGATVISGLIGEGGLSWQTRVADHLPWFALDDPWVTSQLQIGDLYSHRSGLPDHAGDDLASFGVDRRTIQERLRALPRDGFRDHYAYTNLGIQTAADAVAAASGTDWATLSNEILYLPAGMERTTSSYDEYVALENHSVGHSPGPDGEWRVTPEQLNDDIATAAGGVASSVADLGRWVRLLLSGGTIDGERIVDGGALAEAMSAQIVIPHAPELDPAVAASTYGRAFQLGVLTGTSHAFVSHSGAFSQGAGTIVAMVPALDIGVVVLTNGFPIGLAEAVSMEVIDWARTGGASQDWWALYRDAFRSMAADFDSRVAGDPPAQATAPAPADAYLGLYRSAYFGDAEVTASGDAISLTMRPTATTSQTWELEPWDGDTFRVVVDNVDASAGSVSAIDFDRAAGTVAFEFFDHSSGGAGTFTRVG